MHDVIVVGAGAAGAVLASRLSEDPATSVLLLEAGGPDRSAATHVPAAFSKTFHTELDWDLTTEPQPELGGREMYWPRGRVMGGSTAINAMMWVRGNPADYDAWAAAGCEGWAWDDVVADFARAEDTERRAGAGIGRGGPLHVREQRDPNPATLAFVAACEAVGIPRNPAPNAGGNDGVALTQVTQRRGLRHSVASAYLPGSVRQRPNLDVVTGAVVDRIVVAGGRAVAVDHRVDGQQRTAVAGREIAVCTGAVHTPKLLMLSGIGPADHLSDLGIPVVVDAPGVGANLADHLACGLVGATDRTDTLDTAGQPAHMARLVVSRRGPLTSNVAEAHAFIRTAPGLAAPDVELIFAPAMFVDHGQLELEGQGYTVGAVLLTPRSRGTVRLRSAAPDAPVVIDPAYLSHPDDAPRLVAGLRRAQQVLQTEPLAEMVTGPRLPERWLQRDEDWRDHVDAWSQTLYHPVGTARMGSDDDAVVDPELRVRGVTGLRVVDVSIMPTLNTGHAMAPAVMIGEKAARAMARA
jgi:choline dehydrogenase